MNGQNWYFGYENRLRDNRSIADEIQRNRQSALGLSGATPIFATAWLGRQLVRLGEALQRRCRTEVYFQTPAHPAKEWMR